MAMEQIHSVGGVRSWAVMDDWKCKVCDREGKVSVELVVLGVVEHWRRR